MAIPIVDGHNDLLLRLWGGEEPRDVELSRAAESGFAAGFFAVYVPSPRLEEPRTMPYSIPLAEPLDRDEAARGPAPRPVAAEQPVDDRLVAVVQH